MRDQIHNTSEPPWMKDIPVPWREFIRFCQELRFGEINRVAIQDGVPVIAEVTVKKIKFDANR
jgi:hypothetical protein